MKFKQIREGHFELKQKINRKKLRLCWIELGPSELGLGLIITNEIIIHPFSTVDFTTEQGHLNRSRIETILCSKLIDS